MSFSTSSAGLSSELNVTPLIDVLLVLLIIFMVIVPLAPNGLDLAVPSNKPEAAVAPDHASPLLVEIASAASLLGSAPTPPAYRIEGKLVPADALSAALQAALSTRSERQILVRAEPGMSFGVVADVVDRGRAAGADTIGLLTPIAPK